MIAYVDSSVILRILLGQADRFAEWARLDEAVSSSLLRVECLRTLDRARLAGMSDDDVALRREALAELIDGFSLVEMTSDVLERAAEPFPTTLGTLDAIHLSTAILWQKSQQRTLDLFLTHDASLARSARALGLPVRGA